MQLYVCQLTVSNLLDLSLSSASLPFPPHSFHSMSVPLILPPQTPMSLLSQSLPPPTQAPVPATEDMRRNQMTSTTSAPGSPQEPIEVRSENLFQRTEVLAGMYHNKTTTTDNKPPLPRKDNWVHRETGLNAHVGRANLSAILQLVLQSLPEADWRPISS